VWAPSPADRAFTGAVQGLPSGFSSVAWLGSEVGGGLYGTIVVPALAATWFVARRQWKLLALLGAAFALHYVMISPKLFITAYRPSPAFGVDGAGGLESFPSGHVQWAVSLYGLLAYAIASRARDRRVQVAAFGAFALIVVATMFGRIELGRHWLTDTIAGVIVGLIALRLLVALHRWQALDRAAASLARSVRSRAGVLLQTAVGR
jgi:membrane-associated phospholipid phosphatase